MKKVLCKKVFTFIFIFILVITSILLPPEISNATSSKKITFDKEVTAKSKESDSQYFTFTIKQKIKVKISISLEYSTIEDDINDDEYDEDDYDEDYNEDYYEDDDYVDDYGLMNFELSDDNYNNIFDEWEILPGESDSKTVVLEAGTYVLSAFGYNSGINYTLKIKDVSTYAKKITIPSKATVRIGKTKKLKTTLSPSKSYNKGITWKSSNNKIAFVSKTGVVYGKSQGTCTISATLKGGNTAKCKVSVPAPNFSEKLFSQRFFININDFYVNSIGSSICSYGFYNRSSKDVVYVEFTAFQYDNKGDRVPYSLFSGSNCILNDTVKAKSGGTASYYVSDYAQKIRVCVKKVWYADGKTWSNPLYKTWEKKYKKKYS